MAQTFGILGFLLGLIAVFFTSEVMRRVSQRQSELEIALYKAQSQIEHMARKMHHVEKLAAEIRYQKKRQAETLNALAQKGPSSRGNEDVAKRFTPSSARTHRKTG